MHTEIYMGARPSAARARSVRVAAAARRELDLKGSSSAALVRALKPKKSWLKSLARSQLANEAGLSIFALMAGVFWPCCGVRVRGATRACVCGYKADGGPERDLTVHFILGDDGSGVRCAAAHGA